MTSHTIALKWTGFPPYQVPMVRWRVLRDESGRAGDGSASPLPGTPGTAADIAEIAAWETSCVNRVRAGDAEAFGPLAGYYAARIYNHVYRFVRNREDAEDVTQEAFLRAYNRLNDFETGRSFRNWLYAIATNLALNAVRTRTRRDRLHERVAGQPRGEQPNAKSVLDRNQKNVDVAHAVDMLAPRDAALIHLHYREGMTLADAGEALGMTEGAARTALHRARHRLRKILVDGEK